MVYYYSSEAIISKNRPKLIIKYVQIESEPPKVALTSPNGGDKFVVGNTTNITWTSSDNTGVDKQNLYTSIDSGATWDLLANLAGKEQSYEWKFTCKVTNRFLVKVEVFDFSDNVAFDISDTFFTLMPDTVNGSGPLLKQMAWELSVDDLGSNGTHKTYDDSIVVLMQKAKKKTSEYPYITFFGLFEDILTPKMNGWIRIVYSSTTGIYLSLYDEDLVNEGTQFKHRLDPTKSEVQEIFIHICKDNFAQPQWANPSKFVISNVTGVQFEGNGNAAADTSDIKIFDFEIYDGNWVENSHKKVAVKSNLFDIHLLSSKKLLISIPQCGYYLISLVNAHGRIITHKKIHLTAGSSLVDIELNNQANGVYFIQLSGKKHSMGRKFILHN